MSEYCDVALPVLLDGTFTYRLSGTIPAIGARVLVPFREKRLSGIVMAVHDTAPSMQARYILNVLDTAPVLDGQLIRLGDWISKYYIAPLGEVFRTMLPLTAEFRRIFGYYITDAGLATLQQASLLDSGLRSIKSPEDSSTIMEVLTYLAESGLVREGTLRSATGATKETITVLLRKKWIARQDMSAVRDASRTIKVAVLIDCPPGVPHTSPLGEGASKTKLNPNQQAILNALRDTRGRMLVEELRELCLPETGARIPQSTLQTLVKRGLVSIEEEAAQFTISNMKAKSPLDFTFNPQQSKALEHILGAVAARKFSASLLHGVTGSGKTAVYLAAMREVHKQGLSAIMLVPEIGLTPAAAAQIHFVFGENVAILHSGLSDDERAEQWHRIRRGEARIVVGTRSAIFAPVSDLALIIVDEEHDQSYKQEETPRYHARDVAVMRAKMSGTAVVLGSATPSLESYYNAQQAKYALIELPDRVEHRPLPQVELIDMKVEYQETGKEQAISRRLAEEITQRLERGEQAMVLLNRRGFSAFVTCRSCGETLQCRNCAISMTHHKRTHRMECHYCGFLSPIPKHCAKCGSEYINFLGTGSEKLEELLHAMFPQARIGRLDRDTVRGRHDFERVLNQLNSGELDLLVGTQMIAKGHDVHGVTLVGVVGADTALSQPDFRAAERTFQLLTQVSGRAGRGSSPGKVVLQTYFPQHYAVQFAARHDFAGFYDKELRYRGWMHYPPFHAIANVLIRSDKLEDALKYSGLLGQWFQDTRHESVRVLGPAAAPIVRLKNDYRYHILLKSASREKLNKLLRAMLDHAASKKISRTNVIVDVDALSLT
jgi:primosomal protein N' (replication factor Y) (superfamily II helicase)